MKKQGNIILLLAVFIAGFLAGTAFAVWKIDVMQQGRGKTANADQPVPTGHIAQLQEQLKKNPQDGAAWSHLGNLYYDSDQPQKAIEAYEKALQFQPATANLLTDLGVMYRRVNQPDKAIEYFNRAIAQNPRHLPSRFNKGVVLLGDLAKPRAAIAVWEEIIAIDANATTGSGEKIADIITSVKKELAGREKK